MVSWKETTINLLLLAPPQFCQAAAKSKLEELQALEDLVKKQRQVEELLRLKALQDQLQQLQTMTTIQSMKLVTKSPRKHLPVQSPQTCFLDKLIYRFFTSTLLMWDFKYIFSTIFWGVLNATNCWILAYPRFRGVDNVETQPLHDAGYVWIPYNSIQAIWSFS